MGSTFSSSSINRQLGLLARDNTRRSLKRPRTQGKRARGRVSNAEVLLGDVVIEECVCDLSTTGR